MEGLMWLLMIADAPLAFAQNQSKLIFFFFSNSIFIPQFITQDQLPYKCSSLSPHGQQLGAGDVNSAAEFAHIL